MECFSRLQPCPREELGRGDLGPGWKEEVNQCCSEMTRGRLAKQSVALASPRRQSKAQEGGVLERGAMH